MIHTHNDENSRSSSNSNSNSNSTTTSNNSSTSNNGTEARGSVVDRMLATLAPDGPKEGIESPHNHDVLCGRGGLTNHHCGNVSFRQLVEMNKKLYATSPKTHKVVVSLSIVEAIRGQDPPGRFLQRDAKTGLWHDIGKKKALYKTSQALREGGVVVDDTSNNSNSKKRNFRKRARESERASACAPLSIGESTPTHLVNVETSIGKKCRTRKSMSPMMKFNAGKRSASVVSDDDDDESSVDSNARRTAATPLIPTPTPSASVERAVKKTSTQEEQTSLEEDNDAFAMNGLPSCVVDALMELVDEEEGMGNNVEQAHLEDIAPIDIGGDFFNDSWRLEDPKEDGVLLEGLACLLDEE